MDIQRLLARLAGAFHTASLLSAKKSSEAFHAMDERAYQQHSVNAGLLRDISLALGQQVEAEAAEEQALNAQIAEAALAGFGDEPPPAPEPKTGSLGEAVAAMGENPDTVPILKQPKVRRQSAPRARPPATTPAKPEPDGAA